MSLPTLYRLVAFDDTGEWIIKEINFNQYQNLMDGLEGKSIEIPGGNYEILNAKTFTDYRTKYAILEVKRLPIIHPTKKNNDGSKIN